MITTKELAQMLEEKLNGELVAGASEYENLAKYGLDRFAPNTRYQFYIRSDEMELQKSRIQNAVPSTIPTNTETIYICGLLSPSPGSTVEGQDANTYNTVVNSTLELLIPNCDDTSVMTFKVNGENITEELRLSDLVQLLIEDTLSATTSQYITGDDNVIYYIGTAYSRTIPGIKEQRPSVGISLPLSVYIAYSIVATGISSENIEVFIKTGGVFEKIYTTRLGLARTTQHESVIQSDANGVAKAKPNATTLTLSFDAPYRINAIGEAVTSYVLSGEITPLTIMLSIPATINVDGSIVKREKKYTMILADTGISGELNLAASMSVRLIEYVGGSNG